MNNITCRSKIAISSSKDRLRRALLDNAGSYTITKDGRILSNRDTLITAFEKEVEKIKNPLFYDNSVKK